MFFICTSARAYTPSNFVAALTPIITEKSWMGRREKYANISRMLGGTGAEDCADAIRGLLRSIDLDITLSQQGIEEKDIPWMTENLFKVSAGNVSNHPIQFEKEQISEIYREAL